MGQTEFRLLVSIVMLGSVMSRTHFHNSTDDSDGDKKSYTHPFKRRCPRVTANMRSQCLARATLADSNDDDDDDVDFFKKCIVDYFCFEKSAHVTAWVKLPNFRGHVGTEYFNEVAKRVGFFFIRNNDWLRTVVNPKFRDVSTRECTNLLHVTGARYLYVIYVLNLLRDQMTFGPCDFKKNKLIVPSTGVCFPVPHGVVTCTSDFDIALLGARSGSLAALFNQFFREPLGIDPIVAGFGKSVEEIFDTNVHAFTLEYAMPSIFEGLPRAFHAQVGMMNAYIKFKVQEVVSAILKMYAHNQKFFNDLMSDQVELRGTETKHKLNVVFHDWVVQFNGFKDAVNSLTSSDQYSTILSFRHKQNIAFEMVTGLIESAGLTGYVGQALAQNAIALMYASEAYHTRGSIRHVIGITQMQRGEVAKKMSTNDYWVSMLENWADSVKEYNRECVKHDLAIVVCLPRMSKYLWRMLDAMYNVRLRLHHSLQLDLVEMDNKKKTGVRSIVGNWLNNVKRKGFDVIPKNEAMLSPPHSNLVVFLNTFKCSELERYDPLTQGCMDAIQAEIRRYNRRLFLDLVKNDPPKA